MKTVKSLLLIALFLIPSLMTKAQDFKVPKDYKFKTDQDYADYEVEIINCINWLEKTPIDQQVQKRKEASAFFVEWLTGAPNVTISLRGYIADYTKKDPELLMAFMGGWTKYDLEHKDDKNEVQENLAGIRSLIKVYQSNPGAKKNKKIDELAQMDKDGKLESWLQEQLKKG